MREIKFRVWDKENEQFIQFNKMGFLEDGSLWYVQGADEDEKETDPPYFENQNDWKLMQYTGLKDKNGVEMYEGDVVSIIVFEDDAGYLGDVVFENGCFCLNISLDGTKYKVSALEWKETQTIITVIGNIYENPELLEREGK